MLVKAAKQWCLDVLFPKFCFGCRKEGTFFCDQCQEKLTFLAPTCLVCHKRNFTGILCPGCQEKTGIRRFLAPFSYKDRTIREMVHALKYEGIRDLADFFANEIAAFLAFYTIPTQGLLVPIPLHSSRLRERGFNQSLLLAAALSERLGIPADEALSRIRATPQQTKLDSFEKRRHNVRDAFRVSNAAAIQEKNVILVDDVSTSGATLNEAARTLRQAGARSVSAIVIAKG